MDVTPHTLPENYQRVRRHDLRFVVCLIFTSFALLAFGTIAVLVLQREETHTRCVNEMNNRTAIRSLLLPPEDVGKPRKDPGAAYFSTHPDALKIAKARAKEARRILPPIHC